jgi:hypothetical protein
MRHDARFISASEIGTWCYCKKAWHLSRRGYPSSLTEERAAGTLYHESHNQRLRAARQQRVVSGVVMLVCLLILVITLGSAHLWSQ